MTLQEGFHRPGDLYVDPQWHTVDAVTTSSEGSSGVLFARTAVGSYVIKSSSQIVEETFALELGAALGLHVPQVMLARLVPCDARLIATLLNKVRLTSFTETEWGLIKKALSSLAKRKEVDSNATKSANLAANFARVRQKIRKELDRPVIMVGCLQ
jgi:hypothetical protein